MYGTFSQREKREAEIRGSLLERLKQSVQALIQGPESEGTPRLSGNAPKGPSLGHTNNTNAFCSTIEALFIHGLKDSLSEKFASFFSGDPDRMPVPNFWPVIMVISHRDLMEQVSSHTFISSDVGKSRAWLRLALNQNQLVSYLSILASDNATLHDYYRSTAFLRDTESCDIMLRVLQPIMGLSFKLATNAAILNTWTQTPLLLAGIWIYAKVDSLVHPVLPGTDVASTFENEEPKEKGIAIPQTPLSDQMFDLIIGRTPEANLFEEMNTNEASEIPFSEEAHVNIKPSCKPKLESYCSQSQVALNEEKDLVVQQSFESPCTKKPVSSNAYHSQVEDTHPQTLSTCDKHTLLTRSISSVPDSTEYKNLFSDWVNSDFVDNLPEFLNYSPYQFPKRKTDSIGDEDADDDDLGFEVLSKFPSDMNDLLPLLTTLAHEEGIETQNYLCNTIGCTSHIGMIYGKPRLCMYNKKYYCYECHVEETSIIPAYVIHNWDFRPYPVCAANKKWLDFINNYPIVNIRLINPKLYRHIDDLAEAQMLRMQLHYIQAYLFTCRINRGQDLQKLFWPREHLYEHVHLVTIMDLEQIYMGKLVPLLRQAVTTGRQHILQCEVCSPRGFICEVCKNSKILFPFQLGQTFTCPSCCGVYHENCVKRQGDCPRCKRKRSRKQTLSSSEEL